MFTWEAWRGRHNIDKVIETRTLGVLCAFEFYCAVIKQGPDALLTSLNI